MSNKELYKQLCANKNFAAKIHLFAQPFWLDAVAENWDVILKSDASTNLSMPDIVAVLPFCYKGNLLTKRIYLPDFSFYQSIIFLKNDLTINEKNKIAFELFQQLPKTIKSYFKFLPQNSTIDLTKLNYKKQDYFSYFISKNKQELQLSTNHKRNIQKGIKQHYFIEESKDIQSSFSLLISTFSRQNVKSKIGFDEFKKINDLATKQKCGKTIDCFNSNKNLLASAFIVEDEQTVYYLFGGYNDTFKNSGAMTFLLHHIIQQSLAQQKDFNFCGSTKKSIALFFEAFGASKIGIPIWQKSMI